jgi:glycerol-3-phosphate O-acyltransferase
MMEPLRRLVFSLVRAILRALTKPVALGADQVARDLPVCYVLNQRSLTDLVMLDIVASREGLPGPREPLMDTGLFERRRFFFLNRSTGRFGRQSMRTYSTRLLRLQESVRAARGANVHLVPVSIFWSRAPNKERSLIRVLLSENWAVTSRMRRLIVLLFNRRDITVQFGAPIRLAEIADASISDARLTRRIARLLRVALKNQRAALLGPDLSHRRTLVRQIVASRTVRDAIAADAARSGKTVEATRKLAEKHANAIASDMSYITIRLLERVLTWFWNRIYQGVDVHGIEPIKQAATTQTLVYVPSHRSHIDYMLLSYLLYHHGLMIPLIVAGDNLDMPVVGPILRRGGAIFMRRTFRNDRLYATVFAEYLYRVFRRGSPVEYFIEGGRSRTGRLLPARTGLLSMTIDVHERGVARPIAFVPVYIGYERVVEARSYLDELRGATKRRESPLDLVRSLKVIRESFGRVHVGFGAPVSLAESLARHRGDTNPAAALGRELLVRINAAAIVNPVNLVALVLNAMPQQALDEALLVEQVDCYRSLLLAAGEHPVTPLEGRELVAHVESLRLTRREHHPFGDVLSLDANGAVLMTWYRNNVLHVLALPSLIACLVIERKRRLDRDTLTRMIATVYPPLAAELHLSQTRPLAEDVAAWVQRLVGARLLVEHEGGELSAPPPDSVYQFRLQLLGGIVMQTLERFYLAIGLLQQAGPHTIARETLEQRCQQLAQRMARIHGINAPEFFDERLFHNFIDSLMETGTVSEDENGRLVFSPIIGEVTRAAGRVIPVEFRLAVLRGIADVAQDGATESSR